MGRFILQMLVVIEMICINTLTTEKCCTLKKSKPLELFSYLFRIAADSGVRYLRQRQWFVCALWILIPDSLHLVI
mgnify:CR=1 FL=1